MFNPLNAELNPICHLLALLGAHHTLHISRIRVKPFFESVLLVYMSNTRKSERKFMILRYEPKFPVWRPKSPANYSIIITHYLSIISIVTWLWTGRSGVRIWAIAIYLLFSTTVQTGDCTHPASYSMGTIFYCWEVRSPGRDICHSLPSNAEVQNERKCTSAIYKLWPLPSLHDFIAWTGTTLPFLPLFLTNCSLYQTAVTLPMNCCMDLTRGDLQPAITSELSTVGSVYPSCYFHSVGSIEVVTQSAEVSACCVCSCKRVS
jgi:hypothetical protein